MTRARLRSALPSIGFAVAAAVSLGASLWRPAIAADAALVVGTLDAATVAKGAQLAAVGNCSSCHTTAGGKPFAGGVPLVTPFGTIHGTNITPDHETGIGNWSEQAFARAMRDGIARDGSHLYPAFPYDHFTHTSDDDLRALYAFVMTRDPVYAPNLPNDLRFPFSIRPLLAGWNLLFLHRTSFQPDAVQSAEWNRGAYLVESLGHCGGCHAPRNSLGAEKRNAGLSGGEAEGWYVPALDHASPSPLPWTVDSLTEYLRTGVTADQAIAGGPMQEVVASLANASAADVRAIAVYIVSGMEPVNAERRARADGARRRAAYAFLDAVGSGTVASTAAFSGGAVTLQLGATVYDGACARCHDLGRAVSSEGALRLPLAVAVYDPDPRSLIRIIRQGIVPPLSQGGRWMPAFGATLTDDQLTALLGYLRSMAADAPPWPDLAKSVRDTKASP
jgi:mono/diheme cytochrome c family protein